VQDLYAASEERAAALQTEFVVCGSPLMQRAVTDYLHGFGVTDAHIHFNY
jgi:ferredoxin-NADP reductase